MKKLFFIVAAIAMMATTACTTDESVPVNSEALVSFTIDAPELQTRVTDGNGESTNRLQYAFYDAEGKHLPELNGEVENFVGSTTIQIALVEGCSYSALFWADNTAAPYKLDLANKTMKIDATSINGNSDKNDAFYKYETNIDPVEKTRKVELTRPFAQINIATADTAKAANAGFSAVTTEVTVTTHSTLNLATGAVADNDYKTFTYTFAALPTDPGTAKVNGKDYDMLAMNYILVNERELIDITMKVSEEIDGTNPVERKYTTVPVQRNYRTYIVGNLLTTENEFNTMITADWLEDEIYDTNLIIDQTDIENFKDGESNTVELTAEEDWTAEVVFDAVRAVEAWCTVYPTSGKAGKANLTISTQPNDTGEDRAATVVVKAGESVKNIRIVQRAIVEGEEGYVDKIGDPDFQAAIGNKKFVTLQEALNEVEDNQTITLLNRVNLDKMTDILELYRAVNFTLDLDGYRIHSYGNPNYQISREANGMIDINTSKSTDVKNATIIIKDGFLTYNGLRPMIGIAGSTEAQTIVDLENVKISGAVGPDNNISCAVRITHSNVTVNIKSGTKISNDREVASSQVNVTHYPLVEVCCGTLNIYEGAEFIYNHVEHANNLSPRDMVVINRTAGHTNTAVINVYGGYGRVAGSCFKMNHNGGLINIYGGEWIANTDGTLASKIAEASNCVLNMYGSWGYGFTQQTNIYGGILRGSLQALGSGGNGQGSDLNISGGNFNADPTQYVVEGYTATQNSQGYWEVYED